MIIVVIQILIAFSPLIKIVNDVLSPATDYASIRDQFIMIIGFQIALMTGSISLAGNIQAAACENAVEQLKAKNRQFDTIEKIKDVEFYPKFLSHAETAKDSVDICYLAPYPPDATTHRERHKYYQKILSLMKKNNTVRFRRIVRYSEKNIAWIKSLSAELANIPNSDLAILHDSADTEKMPLALSVQIIDDNHVWLVAVNGHEREGSYRDVYIRNTDYVEVMKHYYNRLWRRSEVLIDSGMITEKLTELLEVNK